jgi:hypothetical protein
LNKKKKEKQNKKENRKQKENKKKKETKNKKQKKRQRTGLGPYPTWSVYRFSRKLLQ